ncbi:hypothetical protein C8N46_102484 [Kordia periserrulae]|uniref:DUF6161 domain-containing protein n=1 Tax=Kordia periserrulae TaxID=701523 RepID=A0A2T6C425_9FLAO|nr:DUF6161 domain-containing protein [Kordia periserrulae]PTX63081.1 hypothetical protein C8N46_102484 [Kordia periserrulae]
MNYYTVEELKEKVESLPKEKTHKIYRLSITVNYPHASVNKTLSGIIKIYSFFFRQYKGWEKESELNEYLETSKLYFGEAVRLINNHINKLINDRGFSIYENYDFPRNEINFLEKNTDNNKYIFTYDASETEFIMRINKKDEDKLIKAVNLFAGKKITVDYSTDFFFIQEIFEFQRNEDELIKRSEAEKISLEKVREEFEELVKKAENKLLNFEGHSTEKFQTWFSDERRAYKDWISQTQKSFEEFDKKSKQTITDKEELYDKILQLKAPIKYWEERAEKLRAEGEKWMYWLIGCSVVATVLLTVVLFFISNGTLKEMFEKTGLAIRWSIVFITLISFLAYGIRTFTRLMFSTYHLARDAEERKQLTYVYLALKEDKNIDEKERHLVLQSLFSRSDSGLLKSDTSPTMPGNILEKLSK